MFCFVNKSTDPCFNLACEDYLLHNSSDDFIILSINDPSVIVGKHQVVPREVNLRFTAEQKLPILRRISGGGTVYHDHGNLNFTFIRQSEKGKQIDFRYYVTPVIQFLSSLGIEASFEGKNDIRVNGLKISGNAEHVFRERVLHHGTLLFDASLENMRGSLRQETGNYVTRAVESNRTSVANLRPMLPAIADTSEFMNTMAAWFAGQNDSLKLFFPSDEDLKAIGDLCESKYRLWEWNWGYAPPYTLKAWPKIDGREYGCRIHVKDGIVWECEIDGSKELNTSFKRLIGCRHMPDDFSKILDEESIHLSSDELYKFF